MEFPNHFRLLASVLFFLLLHLLYYNPYYYTLINYPSNQSNQSAYIKNSSINYLLQNFADPSVWYFRIEVF